MKFFQIITLNDNYYQDFNKRNPVVSNVLADNQLDELIRDNFGGVNIFTHYMRKLGYETQLSVSNCVPLQIKWASDHGLSSVVNKKEWIVDIILKQIEMFKPDILFISDPERFDSRFIKCLLWKPSLVIGMQVENIPKNSTDWKNFDIIISNNVHILHHAKKIGARSVELLSSGFPEMIISPNENVKKNWDVIFAGELLLQHKRRCAYLTEVAKMPLGFNGEFSIAYNLPKFQQQFLPAGITMHNRGSVYGYDMYRTFKRGRIVLSFDYGEGDNRTVFEVTGIGSFLLTESHKRIQQLFKPGIEVETFQDMTELNEKIYYYLSHPEKREAIARKGHKRCLQEHSMLKRSEMLVSIIHKYLGIIEK